MTCRINGDRGASFRFWSASPAAERQSRPQNVQTPARTVLDAICAIWARIVRFVLPRNSHNSTKKWRDQAENLTETNGRLRSRIDRLAGFEGELRQFQAVFPTSQTAQKNRDLLRQFERAFPEFQQLREQSESLARDLQLQKDVHQAQIGDLHRIVADLKETKERQGGELDGAKEELRQTAASQQSLSERCEKQQGQIASQNRELTDLQADLNASRADCREKTDLIETQKSQLQTSAKKIEELKKDNAFMSLQVDTRDQAMEAAHETAEINIQLMEDTKRALQIKEQKVQALTAELAALKRRRSSRKVIREPDMANGALCP